MMTTREKKALLNIKHAANDLLGGLENTMLDHKQESAEYKTADALLKDHDRLVNELYTMATTAIYGDGYCCFDSRAVEQEIREINFCGKEWLTERCDLCLQMQGY